MSDSFSRHIIVDGLPTNVTPEKRKLFQGHLTTQLSKLLGHDQFTIHFFFCPETALVTGAVLSFATTSEAEAALAKVNRFPLTKTSILSTYPWSALQEARRDLPDYIAPDLDEDDEETELAHNMADDAEARPMFIVKGGTGLDVEWYWMDWENNRPELYRRPKLSKDDPLRRWSQNERESKRLEKGLICSALSSVKPLPAWSTYGSLVISQNKKGLSIWGGRNMHLLFDITLDVTAFMVSPCENYMIVQTSKDISVFNIRTAKKIRTIGNLDLNSDDLWPVMRFSADDTLVAVCKTSSRKVEMSDIMEGHLNIYTADTMKLLKSGNAGHSFAVPGLFKAEWNPTVGTQMAYVCQLGPNQGWKVVVANILVAEDGEVEQHILNERNFMTATRVDMLWHPAGTHLSVKVSSKGPTEYFLFDVSQRLVPIVRLAVKAGHVATRFAWQTSGDKFAVILKKDGPVSALGDTSILQIFTIGRQGPKVLREVTTSATHLFWAPRGQGLATANFDKSLLNFFVVGDNVITEKAKHSNCFMTNCEWDPSGRYFATWVSSLNDATLSSQYRIYDYIGNEVMQKAMKPFSHLAWRPLPPSLLSQQEVRKVQESMKTVLHDYEANAAERIRAEEERQERERKDQEAEYVKMVRRIADEAKRDGLLEKREEEEETSKWRRYNNNRIKALPEAQRTVHEDVRESKIVARRLIAQKGQ